MCLAAPGKVIRIFPETLLAEVEYFGTVRKVGIMLVPEVRLGDYVLVHAGEAIEVVDPEAAAESIALWKEIYLRDDLE